MKTQFVVKVFHPLFRENLPYMHIAFIQKYIIDIYVTKRKRNLYNAIF